MQPETSPRPSTRLRRRLFPLLLALQILLLPLLAEMLLAWFHPVPFRRPLSKVPESAWTQLFHRRSDVPGLSYELNPGHSGTIRGVEVTVSSLGLRDDEFPVRKPRGTRRIAALGDSVTFGWTVPGDLSWPNQLEKLLNAVPDGPRTQVMNFGVGGYSSSDEAIVLRAKALPLDPDLVILAYHPNDPETEPVQPLHQVFHEPEWWERWNVLRLLAWTRRFVDVNRLGHGKEYRYLHAPDGPHWPSVLRAFDSIRDACAERHIPVVLVVFPTLSASKGWDDYPYADLHQQVIDAGRARGFRTLDLLPVFRDSGSALTQIAADAEHPNAEGLGIAARALATLLREAWPDLFR